MPRRQPLQKVPNIASVQCNFCSKWYPKHRVHTLSEAQTVCEYCLDWHFHAQEFLGGAPPRGCQECDLTWETLKAITPGEQVRMYVVPKDGILQLLCAACAAKYIPQRTDLFKGTRFGAEVAKI
jgi:hypothetical protein